MHTDLKSLYKTLTEYLRQIPLKLDEGHISDASGSSQWAKRVEPGEVEVSVQATSLPFSDLPSLANLRVLWL